MLCTNKTLNFASYIVPICVLPFTTAAYTVCQHLFQGFDNVANSVPTRFNNTVYKMGRHLIQGFTNTAYSVTTQVSKLENATHNGVTYVSVFQ